MVSAAARRAMVTGGVRTRFASRRCFSSAGGAAPQYEGAEATLRKFLPEDHHVVLAVLGGWAGLITVFKLATGGSAEAEAAPASGDVSASDDNDLPSILSDKFDESMNEKWEASMPQWEKDMENPAYAAKWEKSVAA